MGELVNRRRRGIAGIVSMVVGAACLVWVLPGGTAGATHVTPTQVPGNATCPAGTTELKVEPVESGTFTDGTLTVTLVVTGDTFSFTSNIGVDVVIVKGGPNSNVYDYRPGESTGDTGLHAPINPKTGEPFGLSHVSFCYDVEQPTTTTSTSSTSTTSTTVVPTSSTSSTSTTMKPTTTSTSTTSTTLAPTTTSTSTTSTTEKPTTSSTVAPTSTTVAGAVPSTTTTSLAVTPVGQLPRTGSGSQTLLLVAGITLLLGGAALAASAKLGQRPLAEA
jgi:LPXTG-motif cell wall-anchored protein